MTAKISDLGQRDSPPSFTGFGTVPSATRRQKVGTLSCKTEAASCARNRTSILHGGAGLALLSGKEKVDDMIAPILVDVERDCLIFVQQKDRRDILYESIRGFDFGFPAFPKAGRSDLASSQAL